jgi:hypothetical protein
MRSRSTHLGIKAGIEWIERGNTREERERGRKKNTERIRQI